MVRMRYSDFPIGVEGDSSGYDNGLQLSEEFFGIIITECIRYSVGSLPLNTSMQYSQTHSTCQHNVNYFNVEWMH